MFINTQLNRGVTLGGGFLAFERKGVDRVVTQEALNNAQSVPQEYYQFTTAFYNSAEELQQAIGKTLGISCSAYLADSIAEGNTSQVLNFVESNAYYVMQLEHKEEVHTLQACSDQSLLLLDILNDLYAATSSDKLENFYRSYGDHFINSVTYGKILIIILSLELKKIQSNDLQHLQAKVGAHYFTGAQDFNAKIQADFDSNFADLNHNIISNVQIYSVGDSQPDYVKELEKLASLRRLMLGFVNQNVTLEPEQLNHMEQDAAVEKKTNGVVTHYTYISYLDLIDKDSKARFEYEKMLLRTSRASKFLQAINSCQNRIDSYLNHLDIYLNGHRGAFVSTESLRHAAEEIKGYLIIKKKELKDIVKNILNEVRGLSESRIEHNKKIKEARECLDLKIDFKNFFSDSIRVSTKHAISHYLQLLEKLRGNDELRLNLLTRIKALNEAINAFESYQVEQYKHYLHKRHETMAYIRTLFLGHYDQVTKLTDFFSLYHDKHTKKSTLSPKDDFSDEYSAIIQHENIKHSLLLLLEHHDNWPSSIIDMCQVFFTTFEKENDAAKETVLLIYWKLLLNILEPVTRFSAYTQDITLESTPDYDGLILLLILAKKLFVSMVKENNPALSDIPSIDITTHLTQLIGEIRLKNEMYQKNKNILLESCGNLLIQYRLSEQELDLIKEFCDQYIRESEMDTSDSLWDSYWHDIYTISLYLDKLLSVSASSGLELASNTVLSLLETQLYSVLDFKYGMLLLKRLEAGHHRDYLSRTHFFKSDYIHLKVPHDTQALCFKVESPVNAENYSEIRFNVESKKKIHLKNNTKSSYVIYREIHPSTETPIAEIHSSEKLHAAEFQDQYNDSYTYRKIRIQDLRLPQNLPRCEKVWVKVFARFSPLNRSIESLNFSSSPPVGELIDHGARNNFSSTSSNQYLRKATQSYEHSLGVNSAFSGMFRNRSETKTTLVDINRQNSQILRQTSDGQSYGGYFMEELPENRFHK